MATRVLCIEDEFFISELYARALNKAGYVTTVCMNGTDGLEVARTGKYDIVLLDIMIPGTDGTEVLRQLRDPRRSPDFRGKIIITTNLDQDDEARAELEKLADAYIVKADITPNELVSFLQTIVPPADTTGDEPMAPTELAATAPQPPGPAAPAPKPPLENK